MIHFVEQGKGPAFVMQHGLGGQLVQGLELGSEMGPYRLVCMDARGHGKTPYDAAQPASFDQYADDILAVLDHLGIDKALFGGVSMGAGISLNIALRYPERVEALLLIRPAWLDRGRPESLEILRAVADYLGQAGAKDRFAERSDWQSLQQKLPHAANSLLGQFDHALPSRADVLRRMIDDRPLSELTELAKLKLPTLIVASDNDPLHPYRFAERLHEAIPKALLQQVSSRYLDNAAYVSATRQAMQNFLSQI
ncbi:MAG: alpha/beta hydrolase [Bacteroidota bacterium]